KQQNRAISSIRRTTSGYHGPCSRRSPMLHATGFRMRPRCEVPCRSGRALRVRSGARALFALIALVVAVAWGAQALHMTLVAHHLCEAHGQLEHGEASAHDDAFAGLGVVADENHEHCDGLAIEP